MGFIFTASSKGRFAYGFFPTRLHAVKWSAKGIVISHQPLGEGSYVVNVLTPDQGRHGGLYKPSRTAKNRSTLQVGSMVYATWHARLEQHLGTYTLEVLETPYIHFMHDGQRLAALSSVCYLCATLLPERHPYPALYEGLELFLHTLQTGSMDWPKAYADFELLMLQELGFGLDLTACAVTGQRHSLHFISPRTGRAVSYDAGLPYADKLFVLPNFWLDPTRPPTGDALRQALAITGYFISKNLMQGRELPHARRQLCESGLLPAKS